MSKGRSQIVYQQVHDGEWVRPVRRGHLDQCCGCGLVHVVDYVIEDGILYFRARVDRRLTAAARRAKPKSDANG
ncbi:MULTISPECIES: hypothetical protein [unclassified Bradyrhizobium]|uniref:hypothetical protein n=1 Tax=unclassified Bradyrhizobium TaxID=2631580 RepID=UPI002916F656|nr:MULTISPECIES: hypothetical protein [unclassified Bradyrhizobium]